METGDESGLMSGIPGNTNPFAVVADVCIDDGSLVSRFFMYFKEDESPEKNAGCVTYAPSKVQSSPLSQEQAEALVKMVHENGAEAQIRSFAVIERCRHIIPKELRKSVRVAKNRDAKGRCIVADTYYLEE